jgi:hypothetical protein
MYSDQKILKLKIVLSTPRRYNSISSHLICFSLSIMQRPLEKKLGTTTNGESPGHCPSIWLPNPGRAICSKFFILFSVTLSYWTLGGHEVLHSDSARKRKRARNGKPTAEQMMVLFDRAYEAATTFVAALDEVREASMLDETVVSLSKLTVQV